MYIILGNSFWSSGSCQCQSICWITVINLIIKYNIYVYETWIDLHGIKRTRPYQPFLYV